MILAHSVVKRKNSKKMAKKIRNDHRFSKQ
jgi:hypothetical protein